MDPACARRAPSLDSYPDWGAACTAATSNTHNPRRTTPDSVHTLCLKLLAVQIKQVNCTTFPPPLRLCTGKYEEIPPRRKSLLTGEKKKPCASGIRRPGQMCVRGHMYRTFPGELGLSNALAADLFKKKKKNPVVILH